MERKIEGNSGYIFDSAREGLANELFRLQRIQQTDGVQTTSLQDEIIDKMKVMDAMTVKERLGSLRKSLEEF
jgi:hypothetical protein